MPCLSSDPALCSSPVLPPWLLARTPQLLISALMFGLPPALLCSCATARDRRKLEQEKRRKLEEEALAAAAEGAEGEAAAPGQPLAAAIARRQAAEAGPSTAAQQSNAVMAPQVDVVGYMVGTS